MTVVFVVGSAAAAEGVLAAWEAEARAGVGAVEVETVTLGGRRCGGCGRRIGRCRSFGWRWGDVVVVGNSPAAVARVLAAGRGRVVGGFGGCGTSGRWWGAGRGGVFVRER
ncbi:MAG: hypothetical protein R3F65_03240 [bacterium]